MRSPGPFLAAFGIVFGFGVAATTAQETPPAANSCPDGYPRTSLLARAQLIAAFTPSPADVTVCPDGDVYLSVDGPDEVWRIDKDNARQRHAAVSGVEPAGIACDERGRLYVAGIMLRDSSKYASPLLLLVERDGETRALPQPTGSTFGAPNGVAFVPGAGVYTTDMLSGTLVRTRETQDAQFESTIVARNLLGINGIAYDPTTRKLFVSNSLSQQVSSLLVAPDGSLAAAKLEWSSSAFLPMLDGLSVDERGTVYVAGFLDGAVVRLLDEQVVARVTNPASLAFRGGELLVVDYHPNQPTLSGGLYAVPLGRCGAPLFAPRR